MNRRDAMKPGIVIGSALFLLLSAQPAQAAERLRIAATTPSIASIAAAVAGSEADVYAVAAANRNLHFITPTPRDVLKVKKADVFIHGGLDLEVWRGPLLDAVGRQEFISGARAIDVSRNIVLVNKPEDVSRAHGDIHLYGNPHYWTDPVNAKVMTDNIAEGLSALYPESAARFRGNAELYKARLDEKITEWQSRMAPFRGRTVVAYHDSWPYFLGRFGLSSAGFLEPKPGIPPTPRHYEELLQLMRRKNARVIIRETYHEKKTPEKLARETGAAVAVLQQDRSLEEGGYETSVERNVSALEAAFQQADQASE